jgi:hypothetical protein
MTRGITIRVQDSSKTQSCEVRKQSTGRNAGAAGASASRRRIEIKEPQEELNIPAPLVKITESVSNQNSESDEDDDYELRKCYPTTNFKHSLQFRYDFV